MRPANHLLAGIPTGPYRRLAAELELVSLAFGQVLYRPGETLRFVYFPVDCLISLLTAVDKHKMLEIGMLGHEGMAGMPLAAGMNVSSVQALVQGEGTALRMAATPFRIELKRNRPLQHALTLYTHALMAQISQTAACNRFHAAGARLARWLLMTRERVDRNEFPLTQEFLAAMLGLRRAGITEVANSLRSRKLIDYERGMIRILDVKGLEAASCSCYRVVKEIYERAKHPT